MAVRVITSQSFIFHRAELASIIPIRKIYVPNETSFIVSFLSFVIKSTWHFFSKRGLWIRIPPAHPITKSNQAKLVRISFPLYVLVICVRFKKDYLADQDNICVFKTELFLVVKFPYRQGHFFFLKHEFIIFWSGGL